MTVSVSQKQTTMRMILKVILSRQATSQMTGSNSLPKLNANIDVNQSTIGINHVNKTIQMILFRDRHLRYLAGILTEQKRSMVIKSTVQMDVRQTVQSSASHRLQMILPKGHTPSIRQSVYRGIETSPIIKSLRDSESRKQFVGFRI